MGRRTFIDRLTMTKGSVMDEAAFARMRFDIFIYQK
jgi:hypothetical protein